MRAARRVSLAGGLALLIAANLCTGASAAIKVPAGFAMRTAFSGLEQPTAVRFAPNDLVFVAEKRGTIQVFDGLADGTPALVANLRREVFNDGDRGLLALAVDPDFLGSHPYLYALYTRNAAPGGAAPLWPAAGGGSPDATDVDACPFLYTGDQGCLATGRLVRLRVDPATGAPDGAPQTLITGWCQQFGSHSVGDLRFGAGRALYVSAGDGAGYAFPDVGQYGGNPCGDPPGQGGALRAQDLLTPVPADPAGLSGAILRIDPDTGAAAPGNPLAASADADERRILAQGLRNPFRIALRPGAAGDDLFLGDVGLVRWEEINRLEAPPAAVRNFGWPCFEGGWSGSEPQPNYTPVATGTCNAATLPASAVRAPFFAYFHTTREGRCTPSGKLDSYDPPATLHAGSSLSGLAFHPGGGAYPSRYHGGLFFGDYARGCLWFMPRGDGGLPDPARVETFATWSTTDPYAPDMGLVDLQAGPNGDLFIADITGGRIVRVRHGEAPALAAPTTRGASPLAVAFAVSGATPAPGASVQSYAWDLDGDGTTDERTSEPRLSHVFGAKGLYRARVTVEYSDGDRERTDALPVAVDPPREVAITTPGDPAAVRWSVGERIAFAGRASAGDTGAPLPAGALGWSLVVRHCAEEGDCHSHRADSQLSGLGAGNTGASGVLTGPEHEFPAHVELRLVASDPAVPGLQTERTVRLDPATVRLLVTSEPAGVVLAAGGRTGPGPLNVQVIRRSALTVDAPAETRAGGRRALFDGWSDGGAARHVLTPGADASLTARYVLAPGLVAAPALRGVAEAGRTLSAAASFDGSPSTVAWRWERCTPAGACTAIPGAAGARLRPGQADVGRRLRAVATAVNRAGEASGAVVSRLVLPAARPPVRVSRRDTARVALRCPAPRRCAAQIAVRAAADGGGEGFRVAFRRLAGLPARTLARVPVRLTPAARRALARRGALRVHATVRVRAPGGPERVVHTRFRLLAPRR